MDGKFSMHIDLGNDAMRTSRHVAAALHELATKIERHGIMNTPRKIMDVNGNTVGEWHLEPM